MVHLMRFVLLAPLAALALLPLNSAVATAQQGTAVAVTEESPGLLKQARISADSARKVALARVPGSRVKAAEIEREKGRLIYSFDLVSDGKTGVDEVAVDAKTGAVIAVEHETPADEATEVAKDKAKSKPKPTAAPKPAP